MISRPVVVSPVKAILAMRGLEASGLPASSPKPLTILSTPGGRISATSSASTSSDSGRLLGRLDHHRIARRQRRRQLPHRHQNRKIPRNDLPHHPQRLMVVIGHRVLVELPERALLGADAAGKIAKMIHRQRQIRQIRLANRLAVVVGLHRREKRQILLHPIGHAIQDRAPAPPPPCAPSPAPPRAPHRCARSTSSAWRAGDLTDHLPGGRGDVLEIAALRAAPPTPRR